MKIAFKSKLRAYVFGLLMSAGLAFAGLETGTYISDLVSTNPLSSDLASTADDHIRLLKATIKATFPNINAAVTLTDEQINDAARKTTTNSFTYASSGSIDYGTRFASTRPVVQWIDTDVPDDIWVVQNADGNFRIDGINAAASVLNSALTLTQTAGVIDSATIAASTITLSGNVASTGTVSAAALINGGATNITGVISPAEITSDQNDYNPTDLSTASVVRLSSDAARAITGLAAPSTGRVMHLFNVGDHNITLRIENASSSANNRFAINAVTSSFIINNGYSVTLWYDTASDRWRFLTN